MRSLSGKADRSDDRGVVEPSGSHRVFQNGGDTGADEAIDGGWGNRERRQVMCRRCVGWVARWAGFYERWLWWLSVVRRLSLARLTNTIT